MLRGGYGACPSYFFLFSDCCCIRLHPPPPRFGTFSSFFFCFVSHFESRCARRTLAYFGAAHVLPSELLEVCPLLCASFFLSSVLFVVLPVLLLLAFSAPVRFFRSLSRDSALLWAARLVERSMAHAASGSRAVMCSSSSSSSEWRGRH